METETRQAEAQSRFWWLGLALPVALSFALAPVPGIWDPHEQRAADLARRVAIQVFRARDLGLPGSDDSLPTLGDLGRMELPTTSVALFFRLFGLSEGAGRLPIAAWGSVGLAAVFFALKRFAGLRTAAYGALVLATTPLFFAHARSMLGDVVPMAGSALAFAGLGVALLDDGPLAARRAAFGVGLAGLIVGFFSRGALLGVAVPTLAVGIVGLAANALARSGDAGVEATPGTRPPPVLAVVATVIGCGIVAGTLRAMDRATPAAIDPFLGSAVLTGRRWQTFDVTLSELGYALFPWSALLPLALGRLLVATSGGPPRPIDRLRALVAVGSALAFSAHAFLAPKIGPVPFVHVGLVAMACALLFHDLHALGRGFRAVAYTTSVGAALIAIDFGRFPEKGLVLFGIPSANFPHSFEAGAALYVALTSAVLVLGVGFAAVDPDGVPEPRPGDEAGWHRRLSVWDDGRALVAELGTAMGGNVAFVVIMAEAALVGIGAVVVLSEHTNLFPAPPLSPRARGAALSAWAFVPSIAVVGYLTLGTARRALSFGLVRAGASRAHVAAFAGIFAGSVLFFGYFPALAGHLSPKGLFVTYERVARPGQPIGTLGVAGRSVAYYTKVPAEIFADSAEAFTWLVGGAQGSPDERRFLAVRAEDFARLNALFRQHANDLPAPPPEHNVPVIDGRSSQLLLLSNQLLPGERDDSFLRDKVRTTAPSPAVVVRANLADQLEIIGWDLVDPKTGARLPALSPGRRITLRVHLHVRAPVTTEWDSFLHIDGHGHRFNADQKPLGGRYPMSLWQVGDYITESLDVLLDPSFRPGAYTLFFGFFVGDKRLPVLAGKHHEDRVDLGSVQVR